MHGRAFPGPNICPHLKYPKSINSAICKSLTAQKRGNGDRARKMERIVTLGYMPGYEHVGRFPSARRIAAVLVFFCQTCKRSGPRFIASSSSSCRPSPYLQHTTDFPRRQSRSFTMQDMHKEELQGVSATDEKFTGEHVEEALPAEASAEEKMAQAEHQLDILSHSHGVEWEKRTTRKVDIRLLIILGLCYAVSLM